MLAAAFGFPYRAAIAIVVFEPNESIPPYDVGRLVSFDCGHNAWQRRLQVCRLLPGATAV